MHKKLSDDLKRIETALDLGQVVTKAKETHSWADARANYALGWYVKHWFLLLTYPDKPLTSISAAADDLWHQHVLDTRKYATDCEEIAGRFIHHTPFYGDSEALKEMSAETAKVYLEVFDELPLDSISMVRLIADTTTKVLREKMGYEVGSTRASFHDLWRVSMSYSTASARIERGQRIRPRHDE